MAQVVIEGLSLDSPVRAYTGINDAFAAKISDSPTALRFERFESHAGSAETNASTVVTGVLGVLSVLLVGLGVWSMQRRRR